LHDRWWGKLGDPGDASAASMTFEFRHGPLHQHLAFSATVGVRFG
jgi:hypothetical protein